MCHLSVLTFRLLPFSPACRQAGFTSSPLFNNLLTRKQRIFYICGGVSLLRPAPLELPQGGNAARVESCSGAIKVAYPFLFSFFWQIKNSSHCHNSTLIFNHQPLIFQKQLS